MCNKTATVFRCWHAESTFQSCGLEHESNEPSPLDIIEPGITETRTTLDMTCESCARSFERLPINTAFVVRAVDRLSEILKRKMHPIVQILYEYSHETGKGNIATAREYIEFVREYIGLVQTLQAGAKTWADDVAVMMNYRTQLLSYYEEIACLSHDREIARRRLEGLDICLRRVYGEIAYGEDPLTIVQDMELAIDRVCNDARKLFG